MKWPKSKLVENEGVQYIARIVNEHGSIFRPVHLEDDVGIDGIIELVEGGEATGKLFAVQVKSGDSYLTEGGKAFSVTADPHHIRYWRCYPIPVILVCYSPMTASAAWLSLQEYLKHHVAPDDSSITVKVPIEHAFSVPALEDDLAEVVRIQEDERLLIHRASDCLCDDEIKRRDGLLALTLHPASRCTRLTAYLSSVLVLDDSISVAQIAAAGLEYCANHSNWSFRPDLNVQRYAARLCTRFGTSHVRRLMQTVTDCDFAPASMGEFCCVILSNVFAPDAEAALDEIVQDQSAKPYVRANALYVLYGLDWSAIIADKRQLRKAGLGDVLAWMEHSGSFA